MATSISHGISPIPPSGVGQITPGYGLTIDPMFDPMEVLRMRLRVAKGYPINGIFHVDVTYRPQHNQYLVFVVCNDGKYVVLEDGQELYPSDNLVTQLLMLMKAGEK